MVDPVDWRPLAEFLSGRLAPALASPIEEETPLLSSGLLDSFTLIELMAHLQKKWDVQIPSDRLTVEQFDTLGRITELIRSLRSA